MAQTSILFQRMPTKAGRICSGNQQGQEKPGPRNRIASVITLIKKYDLPAKPLT
jgi:hypothetical protein